jgi:hypothetical protein
VADGDAGRDESPLGRDDREIGIGVSSRSAFAAPPKIIHPIAIAGDTSHHAKLAAPIEEFS